MIILAADHGGFELKQKIKRYLNNNNYEIYDVGAHKDLPLDNFNEYVKPAISELLKDNKNKAIFVCGSGVGVSICSNRYKKVYAANCHNISEVKTAREHNNINVLCFGGRTIDFEYAKGMIDVFFNTTFIGGKYKDRMDACDDI